MSLERLAPALFVLLWSTGWIAPVYGIGHASAEIFLVVRFALAALAFAGLSLIMGARWPREPKAMLHATISGMLLHGVYLGGVWWAIFNGVPASVSGVIAALQPLMTAALAPWLVRERLSLVQITGLVLGLVGILIALSPSMAGVTAETFSAQGLPILINVGAMVGAVLGTLYQKRYLQVGDLRTIGTFQYLGAFLVVAVLALIVEEPHFDFSLPLMGVLLWSVFGLSMGAVGLLLYLVRRGQVARAASLIYLIPPTVAVESFLLLGEPLQPMMIIGTLIVVVGLWLAGRKTNATT
ncbi:DMT family transporter [Rhizobium alvei]|uniref:DMT family transporter n=1 Tax=Rhizobium alvei TaxID=1132659 RepID=A0ABT8YM69_9HYPH|nr:DMT family transporter [Rhizobium alvei]MDO6964342.1 DMT family transporter [Rhizobium alvei]